MPPPRAALALAFASLPLLLPIACARSGGDRAGPVPDAERITRAPSPPPSTFPRAEATVVRYLAVGWAHVLDVTLTGEVRGSAALWVPVGDPHEEEIVAGAASSGATLSLQLESIPPPDGGIRALHELHLEQYAKPGFKYWRVREVVVGGR